MHPSPFLPRSPSLGEGEGGKERHRLQCTHSHKPDGPGEGNDAYDDDTFAQRVVNKDDDEKDEDDHHHLNENTTGKENIYATGRNTLETNMWNITMRKVDTECHVDPLLHKMSAAIDGRRASGLLVNNMFVDEKGEIIFDSSEPVSRFPAEQSPDAQANEDDSTYDLGQLLKDVQPPEENDLLCVEFLRFYNARMKEAGGSRKDLIDFSAYAPRLYQTRSQSDSESLVESTGVATSTDMPTSTSMAERRGKTDGNGNGVDSEPGRFDMCPSRRDKAESEGLSDMPLDNDNNPGN